MKAPTLAALLLSLLPCVRGPQFLLGQTSVSTPMALSANSTDKQNDATRRPLPEVIPSGRKSVGLALEGGGALGLAHIGVLRWFEENHIPVDRIAGTSMGSLIGGLYASGVSLDELKKIASGSADVFTLQAAYSDVSFRRREDRRELPQAISLGLNGGIGFRNAVLTDTRLNDLLRSKFASYNSASISFNDLPIPFRCVATDLNALTPVVFDAGSMADAVRASISIPGIFSPVSYHGHYLVDGAIMDNLPTDVVKNDLKSDIVIGVHLATSNFEESDVRSVLGIFTRAYAAGTAKAENDGKKFADILIVADTSSFSTSDYTKAEALILAGNQGAEKQRAQLLQYQLSEQDWAAYLAARQARTRPKPGLLLQVKVDGGPAAAKAVVQHDLKPLEGQLIDPDQVSTKLIRVRGSGSYDTSFQTISTVPASHTDGIASATPDNGIVVSLRDSPQGKAILMTGVDVTAASSNVTRMTFDFRLIDRDLGGFGSELKTDVRLGFLTQLSSEYYRLLAADGYFLKPHAGLLRQPVYLWSNQKRISERFEQQAGGGFDVGRTFNRRFQMAAEWRMQEIRWDLTSGSDSSTKFSGTTERATIHLRYDDAVAGAISPKGTRIDIAAGSVYQTGQVTATPVLEMVTSQTFTYRETNRFGVGTEIQTYFRGNIPDPLRFTLGGPWRLSASSIDEYRGTDIALLRGGYMRRLINLPSTLGQGVYGSISYEGGQVWSPERHMVRRQDGVAGIVVPTSFGVITVAGSVGDSGRRKLFFSLGRLF